MTVKKDNVRTNRFESSYQEESAQTPWRAGAKDWSLSRPLRLQLFLQDIKSKKHWSASVKRKHFASLLLKKEKLEILVEHVLDVSYFTCNGVVLHTLSLIVLNTFKIT